MSKELIQKDETQSIILDIQNTQKVCHMLIQTPHYKKLGPEGIFAIVQKAYSLGLNPLEALNGGMYYVQGKVELNAILMAKLIRLKRHSITMDKNSNDTICILHGKRADNGDTWKASFSIEDAKRAGIYKEFGPWSKYPDVMCYNRALSKLARQLFPDVIGNCYVEGEISDAPPLFDPPKNNVTEKQDKNTVTDKQVEDLEFILSGDQAYREKILNKLSKDFNINSFNELTPEIYQKIYDRTLEKLEKEANSFFGEMHQMQAVGE